MRCRFLPLVLCIGLVAGVASAQEPTFHFEGPVPEGPDTFFFLEFDVPEGTAEIEVVHAHDPAETDNVLDWGIDDPNGSRGWGGGNRENAIVGVEAAGVSGDPFEHETAVEAPGEGEDRYRHEVVEGVSRQSLSSYIWLRKGASSGCSCRVPGSPSSDGALLFSLLFLCGWWLLRRRAAGPS